jgi:hypothetical protein
MVLAHLCVAGLVVHCPSDYWQVTLWSQGDPVYIYPGESYLEPAFTSAKYLEVWPNAATEYDLLLNFGCDSDVNGDGDCGDADIEAFFSALTCGDPGCAAVADWDNDGTPGTLADIDLFFWSMRQ